MAVSKIYQPMDFVVSPSKVKSIEMNLSNPARYRARLCMGKVGNAVRYSDSQVLITFMSKNEAGKTIPGLQPEQLVGIVRDFLLKQEDVDPVKIAALNQFLGDPVDGVTVDDTTVEE